MSYIITSVFNCSACTKDHKDLFFKKLEEPFIKDGIEYWYYSYCPDTYIIIYMTEN